MKITFSTELEKAQTILLAGAGGGFDVFCGLPLWFHTDDTEMAISNVAVLNSHCVCLYASLRDTCRAIYSLRAVITLRSAAVGK